MYFNSFFKTVQYYHWTDKTSIQMLKLNAWKHDQNSQRLVMGRRHNTIKAFTHTAWNTAHTVNVHTTVALSQRQTNTKIDDDGGRRTRRRTKTATYEDEDRRTLGSNKTPAPFYYPRVTKTDGTWYPTSHATRWLQSPWTHPQHRPFPAFVGRYHKGGRQEGLWAGLKQRGLGSIPLRLSFFIRNVVFCGHSLVVTLSPTINERLKWLSSLLST